ncbi:MAG: V-type ATP synthase subunit I [Candidatus Improbicoccus devescovinae]|nr:MAG: V-type ATP synthase subunit I [Candidatus Improbicoccus devescovinae]
MISKMEFVSISGFMNEFDQVVSCCAESGVFHVDNCFEIYKNYENIDKFSPIEDSEGTENLLVDFLDSAKKINKKFIKNIESVDIPIVKVQNFVKYFTSRIKKYVQELDNLNDGLKAFQLILLEYKPFLSLDIRFSDIYNCKYIDVFFGKIDIDALDEFIIKSKNMNWIVTEVSRDKKFCYIYVCFIKNVSKKITLELDNMGFKDSNLIVKSCKISEEIKIIDIKINNIKRKMLEIHKKIDKFWEDTKIYASKILKYLEKIGKFSGIKFATAKYEDKFVIVGWVPKCEVSDFIKKINLINNIDCEAEAAEEHTDINPPIKLINKKIFSPFEFFVQIYGMPLYGDFDPTVFVAITYTCLFGIMFADLGQGLVLALCGYVIYHKKKNNLAGIMFISGLASCFFGMLFGSVFGFENLLDPIYENLLGMHNKPIEIMDSKTMMLVIFSAIFIGILLLILVISMNVYYLVKKKKIAEAFLSGNGLCGLIFYCVMMFFITDLLFLKTGFARSLFSIVLLVLPLILIFLKDILKILIIDHKINFNNKWGNYILTNFFKIFELILGFFTNTISFVRIGVFVFVHYGMMMVVFNLAELSGSLYYPVIILGNLFVIGFEALLVGLQVMRLEFCELFGRFFKGGGRPFDPVMLK